MLVAVGAGLVVAAAALLFIAATPDTALAAQTHNADVWAGWSVHPPSGVVTVVQSDWTVPEVGCFNASQAFVRSRAAVFVGMWGRLDEFTKYLPQVGTTSNCRQGGAIKQYHTWAELYGPGDQGPKKLFEVKPHDRIRAQVSGYRKRNGQLTFNLYIQDFDRENRGQKPYRANLNLSTPRGVKLENVVWHGGCIVESDGNGALAKFNQPIWFAPVNTGFSASGCEVNGEGIGRYPGGALHRYNMNSIVGKPGAAKPRAEIGFPDKRGRFTVTWKRFES